MQHTNTLLTTHMDLLHFTWRGGLMTGNIRMGFFLGLLGVLFYLYTRIDLFWPAKLLWAYCLARVIYQIEFPTVQYGFETMAFRAAAGENAIEVALIPLFILMLSHKHRTWIWKNTCWLMLFELANVWLGWKGLLLVNSFNLAFVALYLPLGPLWLWALAVPTILSNHAGTAQVMLALYAIIYAMKRLRWQDSLAVVLGAVSAAGFFIWLHSHNEFLDMDGRLARWNIHGRFMNSWLYADHTGATHVPHWGRILFGVGANTFANISLRIDDFSARSVIFLHNEFLQIPWELGLVALGLALTVYIYALWRARKDTRLFMAMAAITPICLTWHIFRFFPTAVLGLLTLERALHASRYRQYGSKNTKVRRFSNTKPDIGNTLKK